MKGLLKDHPMMAVTALVLMCLSFVLFFLNWLWLPGFYHGLMDSFGAFGYLALIPLFLALLISFGYLLFRTSSRSAISFAVIAIVELILCTFLLYHIVDEKVDKNIGRVVDQTSELFVKEVETNLTFRLFALSRLAKSWHAIDQHPNQEEWQYDAQQVMLFFPGFQAIQWVGPDYKVKWVVPQKGNESINNLDIRFIDARMSAFSQAKDTHQAITSSTVSLRHGGLGFLIYVPVYVGSQFDGFIVGVINYQQLFDELLNQNVIPGYNAMVAVNGQQVYVRSSENLIKASYVNTLDVTLQDLHIEFQLWPSLDLVGHAGRLLLSSLLFVALLVALLVILLSFFAFVMQRYTQRLEHSNTELVREMKERQQAEKAREKMKLMMLQGQKLEALGTLAGGIAHNFNNILYSIMGYAQLVAQDVKKGSVVHRNVSRICEGAQRGKELVQGIMSFSRQTSYQFEPVVVKTVIEDTLKLLQSTLPATIELRQCIDLTTEKVNGNLTQLQQVLMNVISNASDAVDALGEIVIEARVRKRDSALDKQISGLPFESYISISIADNGKGMSEQEQERIFEPFFTTKDIDKGTGLGLATARSIIQEHQGEILVESELGKGTCFILLIPQYVT